MANLHTLVFFFHRNCLCLSAAYTQSVVCERVRWKVYVSDYTFNHFGFTFVYLSLFVVSGLKGIGF